MTKWKTHPSLMSLIFLIFINFVSVTLYFSSGEIPISHFELSHLTFIVAHSRTKWHMLDFQHHIAKGTFHLFTVLPFVFSPVNLAVVQIWWILYHPYLAYFPREGKDWSLRLAQMELHLSGWTILHSQSPKIKRKCCIKCYEWLQILRIDTAN